MSRAKAWRRAALATYIAAGAALTLAGYTVATTAANANTLRNTRERIEDFQREQTAIAENAISAASVRRGTLPPDTRPPVAPDWPELAERAMPSVVALAGIEKPYGTGESNHAWRIPGVQQNAATAALHPRSRLASGLAERGCQAAAAHHLRRAWPSKETRC
ncbi:hypothetical protein [Burkholderia vietnamiensis]|uniref:hypothetical protein n=1 Tax=Burkholderia vietnamiensis TaxID=60552 RepID=UPI001590E36E|nr:hypothetical protein [Burkholderia vietnamiensis]